MFISCNVCGKQVSTEVPNQTLVRGWVECPECCTKNENKINDVWIHEINCENCKYFNFRSQLCDNQDVLKRLTNQKDMYGLPAVKVKPSFGCIFFVKK